MHEVVRRFELTTASASGNKIEMEWKEAQLSLIIIQQQAIQE
jgi:hypothetical protein